MEYTLDVGETAVIHRNILATTWSVVYAGSPAEGRYSLVVTWSFGHQASSYNLYLTESVREVRLKRGMITVLELTPERIRFRYDRAG